MRETELLLNALTKIKCILRQISWTFSNSQDKRERFKKPTTVTGTGASLN